MTDILDQGFDQFNADPDLKSHLANLGYRGLKSAGRRKVIVDHSRERKELSGTMLLSVALTLAKRWKTTIPEKRVGVVFPAGLGGVLTNLALSLIGKVPVNLNFTIGRDALAASIEAAGLSTIITAKPVIDKLPDFPWTPRVVDLMRERTHLKKADILWNLSKVVLLPASLGIRHFGVPTQGGQMEAGLLFSSGSTGLPKGIPLSHSNVIANCLQIRQCELLHDKQILLACLPTFHSFGFTATLWYPLITGMKVVTCPSPLETKKIAEVIQQESVTVMMGTPTFLRPYFKRATVDQLKSLSFVVAGAEKTPPGFARKWENHFGSEYIEGYGLTETSPVACVNLPAIGDQPPRKKRGSVGQLLHGMKARVCHPTSREILPLQSKGILELQGANVFRGYLNDPESTHKAFHDGWFTTGDLAYIDEEGYVFIEGRVSRFSKIGGEMVPHGRVEQVIAQLFSLDDADEPLVAVTGIQDEIKGEALILLTTVEIRSQVLRERLLAKGIPNLWIPRIIRRVAAIPSLASGKLDLQALKKLAEKESTHYRE